MPRRANHHVVAQCALASLLVARNAEAAQAAPVPPSSSMLIGSTKSSQSASASSRAAAEPAAPPTPSLDPAADLVEPSDFTAPRRYASRGVVELGGFANVGVTKS